MITLLARDSLGVVFSGSESSKTWLKLNLIKSAVTAKKVNRPAMLASIYIPEFKANEVLVMSFVIAGMQYRAALKLNAATPIEVTIEAINMRAPVGDLKLLSKALLLSLFSI